ncbi:MAG: flagellar basal body-associated FliL family protein [Treponema sp.]|jgi:flagellar FliL protein|nr:flagellar basal body-associated FliL family protein [Treponema sp.]
MSDNHEDLNMESGEASGEEGASKKKKVSGLVALLPTLLKFVAIGLGALAFIVTVAVVTFNILNKGGKSQTVIPENFSYIGTRPQYSMFTAIGTVRARTKDPTPYAVVIDMVIGYDLNDNAAATELTGRLYELRDFVRSYFSSKYAAELQPENEARLKQEIIELLNTRILNTAKARTILFNQLDAMEM